LVTFFRHEGGIDIQFAGCFFTPAAELNRRVRDRGHECVADDALGEFAGKSNVARRLLRRTLAQCLLMPLARQ
jgi:hypothetical protein